MGLPIFFMEVIMIRLARAEDIPRLQELLGQILLVHHHHALMFLSQKAVNLQMKT